MTNLNHLIERLCDADVDFVIVGGFAAMLHGSSLVTRDLDVCAVLSHENVEKLRARLSDLKPVHRMTSQKLSFLENPSPGASLQNLYLETELGPLDILGSIAGVGDYARVRVASIEIHLFGRRCRVMSLEDLIRAKESLGREKDLLALKELRSLMDKSRS